jgi:hypothetical protein
MRGVRDSSTLLTPVPVALGQFPDCPSHRLKIYEPTREFSSNNQREGKKTMKPQHRSTFLVLFTLLLLVCGLSLAASTRAGGVKAAHTSVDCASDCAEKRDKTLERCARASSPTLAQMCRDMASKQYDKCIENCNGGNGNGPSAQP